MINKREQINILKFLLIFILFVLQIFDTGARNKDTIFNINLEAKAYYGFIWAHRPVMDYLVRSHVPCFDICLSRQTYGQRTFSKVYRYPEVGAGYYFNDFYSDILGQTHAVYGYINIPVIRKNTFLLNYRIATGIAYLTKYYVAHANYYNQVIGSPVNMYFNLSFDARFRITKRVVWINGIGITHFSNGAFSTPNLGINVVAYNTGVQYNFGNIAQKFNDRTLPHFKPQNEIIISFHSGVREIYPPDEPKYLITSLYVNFGRIINYKRRFGIGLDLIYDKSIETRLKKDYYYNQIKFYYLFRPGVHVSYDFIIDNFSIIMQGGVYLYSEWHKDGYFYTRYGLRYKFSNHWFANVSMITHFAKAYFIEWGGGYYL